MLASAIARANTVPQPAVWIWSGVSLSTEVERIRQPIQGRPAPSAIISTSKTTNRPHTREAVHHRRVAFVDMCGPGGNEFAHKERDNAEQAGDDRSNLRASKLEGRVGRFESCSDRDRAEEDE